jgi:hypothetical protein
MLAVFSQRFAYTRLEHNAHGLPVSRTPLLLAALTALSTLTAAALGPASLFAAEQEDTPPDALIGYTEFRADLPGGRYVNEWTMRAVAVKADGTGRRVFG